MRVRPLIAVLVGLALVSAGCVSSLGSEEDDVAPQGTDDANQTAGNASSNSSSSEGDDGEEDESSSSNETSEEDERRRNRTSKTPPEERDEEDDPPPWPSPAEASIRPGVSIVSSAGQCTSNFLFRTPDNGTLMLGLAAHCVADGPTTNGDGCDSANTPMEPGTKVRISGASSPGVLVYSSWWTMQENEESSSVVCNANDFALIGIHPDDRDEVHPAVLHFGGPTGLVEPGNLTTFDKVLWYGNSGLRPGIDEVHRNEGYVLSHTGWHAVVYSVSPGVQGDSGSGLMTNDGQAMGVLSTVRLSPQPGSNGIGLLAPMLAYANDHGVQAELVTWDQMDAGRLP